MTCSGAPEEVILGTLGNLAGTYCDLGRQECALRITRDIYQGFLKLNGEESGDTILASINYATSLGNLNRFNEAKSSLRKTMPVVRRILGESHQQTLKMRKIYAKALFLDDGATLDDLREAVMTLVEIERTARRVLGGAHPLTVDIEDLLRDARVILGARETPSTR